MNHVDISAQDTVLSYQIDVPAVSMVGTTTIANVLGYYGHPGSDVENKQQYLEDVVTSHEEAWEGEEYECEDREDPEKELRVLVPVPVLAPGPITRIYTRHTYPLSRTVFSMFDITPDAEHPLTYGDLLYYYTLAYQEIFYLESVGLNEPPKCISGMLNRQTTEGSFGIWGHSINDLLYNGVSSITPLVDASGIMAVMCHFDCDS